MADYTGYSDQVPAQVNAIEPGFPGTYGDRWRTDTNGYVTALRFYKGTNVGGGLHVMLLYNAAGTELARITSSDTDVVCPAWVTKTLTSAIAITSTTSYVATTWWAGENANSCQTSSLHATSINNPPLFAPIGSVGAYQGLYTFGAAPSFPTSHWADAGYFNDFVLTIPDTQTSAIPPDSIAASSNLTGAVGDIDEDPDTPDGNWATADASSTTTDIRVTFGSPPAELYGEQNFRVLLRPTAGAASPFVTGYLFQNGTTITNLGVVTISSTSVAQWDWSAWVLASNTAGTDIELRLLAPPGVSIGAVPAWSATPAPISSATEGGLHTLTVGTVVAGDLAVAQLHLRNADRNGTAVCNTAGWTAFDGNPYGVGYASRQALFYRIIVSNETGSLVVFSVSAGITVDLFQGTIHRFTAAQGFAATPIVNIASNAGTNGPVIVPNTVATGPNQCAVALIAEPDGSTMVSIAGESGGDWSQNFTNITSLGGAGTIGLQTAAMPSGGTMTGGTLSFTGTASMGDEWSIVTFCLVPAGGPNGETLNTVEIGAIEWNARYLSVSGGVQLSLGATGFYSTANFGIAPIICPLGF